MKKLSPPLDFICVGAPKAGTTTLYFLLKKSGKVCLPHGKENPVLHTNPSQEMWRNYILSNFPRVCTQKRGKIEPSYWYMPGFPSVLAAMFPDIRIIILLRDPVKRFFSHYKMLVRRGKISPEGFHSYIENFVQNRGTKDLSEKLDPSQDISAIAALLSSEYVRIINEYAQYFPKDQILILFIEDFRDPIKLDGMLSDFLDIGSLNLKQIPKRHSGDIHPGKVLLWKAFKSLYHVPFLRSMVRMILPEYARKSILTRVGEWITEYSGSIDFPDADVRTVTQYIMARNRGLKDIIARFRNDYPDWVAEYA